MKNQQLQIGCSELVTSRFGEWPSFHDAEVVRLELRRFPTPRIELDLYYFRTDRETDTSGRFRREDECIVVLWFKDIEDVVLEGFNLQNVLACMTIEVVDEVFQVVLHPCYGVSGQFRCREMEVREVRAIQEGCY